MLHFIDDKTIIYVKLGNKNKRMSSRIIVKYRSLVSLHSFVWPYEQVINNYYEGVFWSKIPKMVNNSKRIIRIVDSVVQFSSVHYTYIACILS